MIIVMLSVLFCACGDKIELTLPTVEMQDGSQPLATAEPQFSWQYEAAVKNVVQVDYRIVVASTEEKAREGVGDLWDSKTVSSSQMLYVPYEGKELQSRDRCWWKVYATVSYGKNGKQKKVESDVHSFEISLLKQEDWLAHWIGRDFDDDVLKGHTVIPARYLKKDFDTKREIEKARLYISGLGSYQVFLNSSEVAPDEMLKPAVSDYTKRIYFNAYDVTDMLREGRNRVDVTLAGGRFSTVRYDSATMEWCGINHAVHYGKPMLIAQLEVTYKDGTTDVVATDSTWKITNRGPIRASNEFDGETYDESFVMDDEECQWLPVVADFDRQNMDFGRTSNPKYKVIKDPSCTACIHPHWKDLDSPELTINLVPQPNPNIRVMERVKPVAIFKKGDRWILDMGQNMVGVLEVKDISALLAYHSEEFGFRDTLMFRYAETLTPDSNLYTANLRSAECTDRYISCLQRHRSWHPSFVYHGFRYVEVTGVTASVPPQLENFEGLVMYDAMETTGTFECSNEVMNAVYRNAYWGIRGNYRSMPTDCPQRDERMGWTGDRTTGNYGESYIFDNHRLYAKWLQDLEDCQWENGSLSDVAPAYWRNYTDNMTWPGAFITVADMIYTRYGDIEPIRKHYDAMKRWLMHMKACYLIDGILVRDTYGDWCMPPESPELIHSKDTNRITWPGCLSTPYYSYLCTTMQGFALWLGRNDDAVYFQNERDFVDSAFNAHYLDTVTGRYANNTVTANILPLWFEMTPRRIADKVFGNIVDKTEKEFGGHVSTGVVGIQHLMRTLTEYGRGDLALRLASNDTYPSWGYMWRKGATTIWELWNGDTGDPSMNSGNHVMLLGDLILWEYEYLGGIRPLAPGYSLIELKPYPIEGLDYVKCSYQSVSGRIESSWRRKGGRFEWDITVPPNTTAEVYVPSKEGHAEKRILGSGKYHLKSEL